MTLKYIGLAVMAVALLGSASVHADSNAQGKATGQQTVTPRPGGAAGGDDRPGAAGNPANVNQGTKRAGDMATKKGQDCPPGLDAKKVC